MGFGDLIQLQLSEALDIVSSLDLDDVNYGVLVSTDRQVTPTIRMQLDFCLDLQALTT